MKQYNTLTVSTEIIKKKRKATFSCYRTVAPGLIILILRKKTKKKKKKYTNLIFLIDLWKIGLKDFFVNQFPLKRVFKELLRHSPENEVEEISRHEAAYLLARSLLIAESVGTQIKPSMKKWLEKLGIPRIKQTGSLYKCYLCEENDLPNKISEKILKIAKKEYKKGIAGTPKESSTYYMCEDCEETVDLLNSIDYLLSSILNETCCSEH